MKVPRKVFPSLVEAFLNEGYDLYLVVKSLTSKKDFGCDHCGATITVASPDDEHTILSLKQEKDSLERKIVCPNCKKENTRYWLKQAGAAFFTAGA
jgi:DNA-directed RNA polymerase subunit M/transcription elongation factor TFIIS